MAMVNPAMISLAAAANVKDSRWLTLEVCREFQRNKCTRSDTECKFAHPPPHVEVQNGRVTACFDSIKVSNLFLYSVNYCPFLKQLQNLSSFFSCNYAHIYFPNKIQEKTDFQQFLFGRFS